MYFSKAFQVISVVSVLFISVQAANTGDSSKKNGDQTSQAKDSTNVWDKTQIENFVKKAANSNLYEVQIGDTATKKASSQQVREYAQLLVRDHSDALQKLKPAVGDLGIKLPDTLEKKYTEMISNLSKKDSTSFDKEYIKQMIKDHKNDISEFEKAEKKLPPGALKNWVSTTLPVLRQHLTKAQEIEKSISQTKK
jgi:putative membrane protein